MTNDAATRSADDPVYQRADGLWDWRLVNPGNYEIMATSGGQGYTEANDAREGFDRTAAAFVELSLDTPVVTDADGAYTLAWAEGARTALVSREVLERIVAEANRGRSDG